MSDNINFDYKNLSPFKWFVLENFPFIEADFDALTEWQLFCKIGKEINKIINSQNIVGEQAEILTNAFNTLKNYVDNYFNNLDVQDEINNKLNEMAENGELQEILNLQYTEIRQEIATFQGLVNTKLLEQDNQINSIVNNNPIPVSSISEMVDTTKIYVLTSNGYWYYYNGTDWVQGGIYQSSVSSTDVTNLLNEMRFVENSYDKSENTFYENYQQLYNIPQALVMVVNSNTGWLDLLENMVAGVYKKIPYQNNLNGYYLELLFEYSTKDIYWRISRPSSLFFNWQKLPKENDITRINEIFKYIPNNYAKNENTFYNSETLNHLYQIPESIFMIANRNVGWLDLPNNVNGGVFSHQPYNNNLTSFYIDLFFDYVNFDLYWRYSTVRGNLSNWYLTNGKQKLYNNYIAFGDSITRGYTGSGTSNNPYPNTVAKILGLNVTNKGTDGVGWTIDNNNTGGNAYEKITNQDFSNYNLVTLAYGINDYALSNSPLGEIGSLDNSIIGNMEKSIRHILTSNPLISIIVITPLNYYGVGSASTMYAKNHRNNAGYTLLEMTNKFIELCNKYSIPVINQLEESPINIINYNSALGDGLHPNNNGYLMLSKFLAGKINNYYMIL